MLSMPYDALYDLLKTGKCTFRDDNLTYTLEVTDDNLFNEEDWEQGIYALKIKKEGVIHLLKNNFYETPEFNIKAVNY